MKVPTLFFALVVAAAQLAGCGRPLDFPALPEPVAGTLERRILVTFVDRSIGRELPPNALDRYRSHGGYGSSSWSSAIGRELAERHGLRLMAEWPVTVLGVACVVYAVPPERPVAEVLAALGKDPRVESAQPMNRFRVSGGPAPNSAPYNDPYYRLQHDLHAMRIAAAHRLATGKSVRIAVIDSGVDGTHPDLSGQIAVTENLASAEPRPESGEVHGTAVAGVIAARSQNRLGIVGIAPAARLYALRACWSESAGAAGASCNSFTLALALNEAIRLDVQIINLSLTGPDDPLAARLIRAALDRGVFVVASNSGERGGGFPAHLDQVLAVSSGAVQTGPHSENGLSAPGSSILTTLPHGTYDFMSGSSFAAPHITGLLALMLERKPSLNREEAIRALKKSWITADSAGTPFGVVDACRVLVELGAASVCPDVGGP